MTAYTVTETHGCKVVDRPIPITDIIALTLAWAQNSAPDDPWLCDALIAERLGVALVVGPRSATKAWRLELGLDLNGI